MPCTPRVPTRAANIPWRAHRLDRGSWRPGRSHRWSDRRPSSGQVRSERGRDLGTYGATIVNVSGTSGCCLRTAACASLDDEDEGLIGRVNRRDGGFTRSAPGRELMVSRRQETRWSDGRLSSGGHQPGRNRPDRNRSCERRARRVSRRPSGASMGGTTLPRVSRYASASRADTALALWTPGKTLETGAEASPGQPPMAASVGCTANTHLAVDLAHSVTVHRRQMFAELGESGVFRFFQTTGPPFRRGPRRPPQGRLPPSQPSLLPPERPPMTYAEVESTVPRGPAANEAETARNSAISSGDQQPVQTSTHSPYGGMADADCVRIPARR